MRPKRRILQPVAGIIMYVIGMNVLADAQALFSVLEENVTNVEYAPVSENES